MSPAWVQLQPWDGCVHTVGDPGPVAAHSWGSVSPTRQLQTLLENPRRARMGGPQRARGHWAVWLFSCKAPGRGTRSRSPGGLWHCQMVAVALPGE